MNPLFPLQLALVIIFSSHCINSRYPSRPGPPPSLYSAAAHSKSQAEYHHGPSSKHGCIGFIAERPRVAHCLPVSHPPSFIHSHTLSFFDTDSTDTTSSGQRIVSTLDPMLMDVLRELPNADGWCLARATWASSLIECAQMRRGIRTVFPDSECAHCFSSPSLHNAPRSWLPPPPPSPLSSLSATTYMIRTDIPPVFIAADAEHRWAVAVSARSGSTLASRRGILGLSRLLCLLLFLLLGLGRTTTTKAMRGQQLSSAMSATTRMLFPLLRTTSRRSLKRGLV